MLREKFHDNEVLNVDYLDAQAWKPGSLHAGEKRGVAVLLLGRTERPASRLEGGTPGPRDPHRISLVRVYVRYEREGAGWGRWRRAGGEERDLCLKCTAVCKE